jgi:anti-sigma regulatory factor (Ser/Thr protein kinase)
MKEITVKAETGNIPQVIAFIEEQLEAVACPLRAQMQIDVAVDEMFSNIARYAYAPKSGNATVRFSYDEADKAVSITFIDSGVPFNPLERSAPDTHVPLERRSIGGLGIHLVRKTMDGMEYEHKGGKNILTIRKLI